MYAYPKENFHNCTKWCWVWVLPNTDVKQAQILCEANVQIEINNFVEFKSSSQLKFKSSPFCHFMYVERETNSKSWVILNECRFKFSYHPEQEKFYYFLVFSQQPSRQKVFIFLIFNKLQAAISMINDIISGFVKSELKRERGNKKKKKVLNDTMLKPMNSSSNGT